jgi:hypothetical protein
MPDNDAIRAKSPEELELEKQLALAQLKNKIAQEQRGQFNSPNVTALQGNITSDGTFIESRILARRTLIAAFDAMGHNIVARLRALSGAEKPLNLILYNAADIPCIELYAGLLRQVEALEGYYSSVNEHARRLVAPAASRGGDAGAPNGAQPGRTEAQPGRAETGPEEDQRARGPIAVVPKGIAAAAGALVAPAPMLAGYAAGAALRTAADLASLFRVDTDYKNFDLPIDDTVLAAEFRKVIPRDWKLWHPAQFPVETACGYDTAGSDLLDALQRIEEKNAEALSLVVEMNDKVREPGVQAGPFSGALDALNAANSVFAQVHGLLSCVDGGSKTTTMSLLLRAERLIALMKKEGTYVIKLAAISRGSNKVTKWIWSSAKIRHSAGTELNCLVFAPSGEVLFADTQLKYAPYRLPKEIDEPL